jgi:hypothetical protein
MHLPIVSDVPLPSTTRKKGRSGRPGDGRQEAILALQVGESFWVKTSISSACSLRWWAGAKLPERDWTMAPESGGVRIWRTK